MSQRRPGGRRHFQAPCAADNKIWSGCGRGQLHPSRAAAPHPLLMHVAARLQLASGPAAPAAGRKTLAVKEARLLGGAPVRQVGHEVVELSVGRRLRFGNIPQRLRPAGAPDFDLASCRGTRTKRSRCANRNHGQYNSKPLQCSLLCLATVNPCNSCSPKLPAAAAGIRRHSMQLACYTGRSSSQPL